MTNVTRSLKKQVLTQSQLEAEMKRLQQRSGSLASLRVKEERGTLTPAERSDMRRLDDLTFLSAKH